MGLSGQRSPTGATRSTGAARWRSSPSVVVAWRLVKLGRVPPRVATLGATILGFWVLTAISRAGVSVGGYSLAPPYSSRYLYVGGFFLVLIAVELLRGVRLSPAAWALLGLALLAGLFSHMGAFRDAGRYLRTTRRSSPRNLGRDRAGARPRAARATWSGPYLTAGPYFEASADWGTPARSPAEIAAGPEKTPGRRRLRALADLRPGDAAAPARARRAGRRRPSRPAAAGSVTQRRLRA